MFSACVCIPLGVNVGRKNAAVNTERMKHHDCEQNDAIDMVKNNVLHSNMHWPFKTLSMSSVILFLLVKLCAFEPCRGFSIGHSH